MDTLQIVLWLSIFGSLRANKLQKTTLSVRGMSFEDFREKTVLEMDYLNIKYKTGVRAR